VIVAPEVALGFRNRRGASRGGVTWLRLLHRDADTHGVDMADAHAHHAVRAGFKCSRYICSELRFLQVPGIVHQICIETIQNELQNESGVQGKTALIGQRRSAMIEFWEDIDRQFRMPW
jgi:hypothetical protein